MKNSRLLCALVASFVVCAGCGDDNNGQSAGNLCGNSELNDHETCDDGNADAGDGCSDVCLIEDGWKCEKPGQPCARDNGSEGGEGGGESTGEAVCGNQKVEKDETCDDGNARSGDGCSDKCRVEDGWNCPSSGGKCNELPRCGNAAVEADEQCDDGNTTSGDGCSDHCQIESGYKCPVPGQACAPESCGDGILDLEAGEECDDGNNAQDYGSDIACASNCRYAHYCGDGLVEAIDVANGEECDAGFDTSNKYNGCTADCKRANFCGDGVISHDEKCDDGNEVGGDGCSSECVLEPNFNCKVVDGKTVCEAVACGNGKLDVNEICDDGNRVSGDGCSASCMNESGYRCEQNADGLSVCSSTLGNGVVDKEAGEECDDGNLVSGDGCSDHGRIEPGYVCDITADGNSDCYARACGDGILAGLEECDDGNDISGDGCSKQCKREKGYHCDTAGSACVKDICGDSAVTGDETCDEGSQKTEGCVNCQIQAGWQCTTPGSACTHDAVCGNGILEGAETCEENNECCVNCMIQDHCLCTDGKNCKKGSCGNGIVESGEQCDDGNKINGDGCNEACEIEPIYSCNEFGCKPVCGDGLVIEGVEECDDGNLVSGDGCSSQCKKEEGFTCDVKIATTPGEITLPIVYRDFIRYSFNGNGDGFMTQAMYDSLPADCKPVSAGGTGSSYRFSSGGNYYPQVGKPIPDFLSYCPDSHCLDAVKPELGSDGKPDLNTHEAIASAVANKKDEGAYDGIDGSKCIWLYTCPEIFKWWYRDVAGINRRVNSKITLREADCEDSVKKPGTYCYANGSFWPINQGGYGPSYSDGANNGEFSSEFQTYFKYNGGERLIFNGDDDVWVFFNGHLGVDVGGIHPAWTREITLDTKTAAEKFHMYPGGIYPLHMFHAERCTGGSSFRLTLAGFVAMGQSTCDSVCGDGLIRGNEECDLGNGHVNDAYAQMAGCVSCRLVPKCGNGKVEGNEVCDAGHLCKDGAVEGCTYRPEEEAKGCTTACQNPNCNNGVLEAGEICDCKDGVCQFADPANNGKSCLNCVISGCGDGIVDKNNGEDCDDGNLSNEDMCTNNCKQPSCGDGIVSSFLGEVCDDGVNDGSYGGCGLGCSYIPPYCGDGVVDAGHEVCDDGVNDGSYGGCMPGCQLKAPHCGDGVVQAEYEFCDAGEDNGKGECSASCGRLIN